MARTIPALPFVPPDALLHTAGKVIHGGSATLKGHWLHLITAQNLDYATHHAGVVHNQGWADAQFVVNDPAGVLRQIFRVPFLDDAWTSVQCAVYGSSPTGTGRVVFTQGANTVTVTLGAVAGWYPAPPAVAALALSGWVADPDGDYVDVKATVYDDCEIDQVHVSYADYPAGGGWPAADGAFPAGPIGDFVPNDTAEIAADQPLAADMGVRYRANQVHVRQRRHVLMSLCGILNATAADMHEWIEQYPHRTCVPVRAGTRDRGLTTTVWLRIRNDHATNDYQVHIRYGSSVRHFDDMRLVEVVTAPALSGIAWYKASVTLREARDWAAPADYPGFTQLAVMPDPRISRSPGAAQGLLGAVAWGV